LSDEAGTIQRCSIGVGVIGDHAFINQISPAANRINRRHCKCRRSKCLKVNLNDRACAVV
jgi:hypothetical protein